MSRHSSARSSRPSASIPGQHQPLAPPDAPGSAPATARRRWGFRALAVALPLVGLALLEAGLRLAGYGYTTRFFVHHPAAPPGAYVENQRFPWLFFPRTLARHPNPVVVTPTKPDGVCRIFVLGESAAEGDPAPAFGFSRILEVLLRERYPSTRFEVVNVAFTAINSHVVFAIARECRALHGDFWLVYMGNNEVIGPFGAGTVFGKQAPPLWAIRANLALKATRVGQLLDALRQRFADSADAARGWGGMTMFMGQQVRQDDPRLATVERHFERNLEDIIALGRSGGARVVVSTMVSRLRDWPPFASLHRPDLTEAQRREWEQRYAAGAGAESSGDWEGALRQYEQAAQIDPEFAELQFRWGRACLALGQPNEAKVHLTLARDLDTLRFRTTSNLNEAIRKTVSRCSDPGVRLLDAAEVFAQRSTNGIPGAEWLHEHVHFTFAGNYLLASLFADEVAAGLEASPHPPAAVSAGWLSEDACAARLGFTDSQRYEIASLLARRLDEPIYRQQLDHAARLQHLDQEIAALRGAAKPTGRRRALDACRRALGSAPDDWVLHELTARLLGGVDEYDAAERAWLEVARRIPHSARPYAEIGKLRQQRGMTAEAVAAFTRALELDPDHAEAHVGLGTLFAEMGKRPEAIRHYRQALRLDPTRVEAEDGLVRLGVAESTKP